MAALLRWARRVIERVNCLKKRTRKEDADESVKTHSPPFAVGPAEELTPIKTDTSAFDSRREDTRDDELTELWMSKWVSMWSEEAPVQVADVKVDKDHHVHARHSSNRNSNANIASQLNTCPANPASLETIGKTTDYYQDTQDLVSLISLPEDHRSSSSSSTDLDGGDCLLQFFRFYSEDIAAAVRLCRTSWPLHLHASRMTDMAAMRIRDVFFEKNCDHVQLLNQVNYCELAVKFFISSS